MATQKPTMRTRRKKTIRVPLVLQPERDEGVGLRAAFFMLAVLIAGGLFYAYNSRSDRIAEFPASTTSAPSTTGTAPRN